MSNRRVFFATTVVVSALFAFGSSCGTEVSGDEVSYTISAEGAVEDGTPERFTNARGWQIELTRAQALVGPIYFYSGAARASLLERVLGINQAYACAAHAQFQSGRTLGETPLQFGVDLLGGPVTLTEEIGETGEVRSVELHVQNPGQVEAGNELAESPTATYEFDGVATRDGVSVPFTAAITLPEDGTQQIVDSIAAQMQLDEGSDLHVKIQLDRLFRDVEFDDMATESSQPATIGPGTQAYSSMVFSLRSRTAFVWENGQ
jgi:hypothetical protein